MIRAVIFDMFETLITHFDSPLYFSGQMAEDAGIPVEDFQRLWRDTEEERSTGRFTLEAALESILKENGRYSEKLLWEIAEKRRETKRECFRRLHPQIVPMLKSLEERGVLIGLISNCFSEEAEVIRKSKLFPYFDAPLLSWEQGLQKPDEALFRRCVSMLGVQNGECLYVGDGGSFELETARRLGMTAAQAAWYLREGTLQPCTRKAGFPQLEEPMDVVRLAAPAESASRRQGRGRE